MRVIRSWLLFAYVFSQYLLYRVGLTKFPTPRPRLYEIGLDSLDCIFGWSKGMRVLGGENYPKSGPAVIASNHIRIWDPFVKACAIARATNGKARLWALMRHDFFNWVPRWVKHIVDLDELARMVGGIHIKQGEKDKSQLEPFVKLLCDGKAFIIYPGRSRSRNGQFIHYRGWIRSPGATSYFPGRVHEERPDLDVAVVPAARTYNPVDKGSAVAFGPPMYLPRGADRAGQRAFDGRLVVAMSNLIEINVAHLLSGVLYLRCLHKLPEVIDRLHLVRCVKEILGKIRDRYIDPAALSDLEGEIKRALRYFQSRGMLCRRGDTITLNRAAILSTPARDQKYDQANPVKHLVNQIIHLFDVTALIERAVLGE